MFTGRMAKELGLVDRLGTLEEAIDEARKLAGIEENEELERILLPEPRGLFDDLFGMAGATKTPLARGTATGKSGTGEILLRAALLAKIAGVLGVDALATQAEALVQLSSGRPLMRMPMQVKVR